MSTAGTHDPQMIGRMLRHYRIVQKLGEGGMGVVYRAVDTRLDRHVAIKVLLPHALTDEEQKLRLTREAKTASSLNHPNIITIYDIDMVEGMDFVVMELIAGKSLDSLIGRKGLAMADLIRYAIQVADALEAAHTAGVLHRDIKPGNVMIADQGAAKLLDFGLAKVVESEATDDTLTRTMAQLLTSAVAFPGTVAYMSPEQAEGRKLDVRSDIFSFGILLYEMATGLRPFRGETSISTLTAILRDEPKPITESTSTLAPELDRIVRRCLRKDPARRYQHIAEARVDLLELQDQLDKEKDGQLPSKPPSPPASRRSWRMVAAVAALTCIAGGIAGWALGRNGKTHGLAPSRIVRMTYDGGLTHQPALSPNGTLLAYASDRAEKGNLDIWVQQVGGAEPVQVTRDEADESEPSFSPDGTRIIYRSQRDGGGIYVVSALGGESRLLVKHGRNPSFSPDGEWITYWVGEPHLITTAGNLVVTPNGERRAADWVARMYVAPAAGGTARNLLPNVGAAGPVWLPDGKHILFLSGEDFLVTDIEGKPPIKTGIIAMLRQHGLRTSGIKAMWAVDGGSLILPAESGEVANLYRVSISPRTFQATGELQQLTSGTTLQVNPTVAGDGRMAFASRALNAHVFKVPVDANAGKVTGAMEAVTEGDTTDMLPSITPDGSLVAFRRSRASGFDLWVADLATGKERPLTAGANVTGPMSLSPDGAQVAYIVTENNRPALYVSGVSNGAPRKLCEECVSSFSTLSWLAGGKHLVHATPGTEHWVLRDLESGKASVLMQSDLRKPAADLRVSPDGRWGAFHTIIDGVRRQLFVAPLRHDATTGAEQWIPITPGTAMDRIASWSPDGQLLYFQSDRDGFRCLWVQRLDASKRPQGPAWPLLHLHSARRSLTNLATTTPLALARERLALSVAEIRGDVWMVEPRTK